MSGKIMGDLYDYVLRATDRDVLQCIADHADHDGGNAWCSVGRIGWKLNIGARTVHRVLRRLEAMGVLIPSGRARHGDSTGATIYRFNFSPLRKKEPYRTVAERRADASAKTAVSAKRDTAGKPPTKPATKARPTPAKRAVNSAIPARSAKSAASAKRQGGSAKSGRGGLPSIVADKPSSKPPRKATTTERALEVVVAAGGYLTFRGECKRSEWMAGITDCTHGEISDVLRNERLPDGKRIRLPSGFTNALASRRKRDASRLAAHVAVLDRGKRESDDLAIIRAGAHFTGAATGAILSHPWWNSVCDAVAGSRATKDERAAVNEALRHGAYVSCASESQVFLRTRSVLGLHRIRDRFLPALQRAVDDHFGGPRTLRLAVHEELP